MLFINAINNCKTIKLYMKVKHLLITSILSMLIILLGCDAKKPVTEANAEPVVAVTSTVPAKEPVVPELIIEQPAPVAEAQPEHCEKRNSIKSQKDAKHKSKKDKACKKTRDQKAIEAHNCAKHCTDQSAEKKHCKKHDDKMHDSK
jgi:hypothetical protein